MQRLIRLYKETTGESEVDMHKVAKFATERDWPLPKPRDPLAMLAKEFTQAARQEYRQDPKTGKAYRANHALPATVGGVLVDRHRRGAATSNAQVADQSTRANGWRWASTFVGCRPLE